MRDVFQVVGEGVRRGFDFAGRTGDALLGGSLSARLPDFETFGAAAGAGSDGDVFPATCTNGSLKSLPFPAKYSVPQKAM